MGPTANFGAKSDGLLRDSVSSVEKQDTQSSPIVHELSLTLEEVYSGTAIKRIKISRKVLDENQTTSTETQTQLAVKVERGWSTGTQIIFPREGDQTSTKIPADIIFTVNVQEHHSFTRDANNLVYTTSLPLVQALTSSIVTITTLDERILRIPINEIVHPSYTKLVSGEGMPIPNSSDKMGDLVLKFNVIFPTSAFSEAKKVAIKAALGM